MHWKPQLIKLTHTLFDSPVYIDPTHVHLIIPTNAEQKLGKDGKEVEPYFMFCTLVYYCGNQYIHVKESVEEVAAMCDLAFGHGHKVRAIK